MLTPSFFARPTLRVARDLLGKKLVRRYRGKVLSGLITETEAYRGEDDLACHASRGRTKRTEGLYAAPGALYVYLIYGMYWCLNIVTERKGYPAAVLIRGVEPLEGIDAMARNRGLLFEFIKKHSLRSFTNGPGKLCQAFGVTGALHGKPLGRDTLWIEEGMAVKPSEIERAPRIGVDYAKHCAQWPWRFILK